LQKADRILKALHIKHLKQRIVFDLSGGEQKTVKILNAIDKSIIIVSHYKSFMEQLVPTVYRLHNGEISGAT
jgi:cobalt/nickel transport system ATP-binding protein